MEKERILALKIIKLLLKITQVNLFNEHCTTFLAKVLKTAKIHQTSILICLAYIQRIFHSSYGNDGVSLSTESICKLFVISLIVAQKFNSDTIRLNQLWAKELYPWVELEEVSRMERQFLILLDYKLVVSESDLENLELL